MTHHTKSYLVTAPRAEFNCINAVFQDFVLLCRCLFLPPCYLYILICRYGIKRRTIAQHKADAWNHLRDCERLLPRNCMTTALHALAHAWDDVANFGPWYVFWTLPLERYMKFMRANIFSGTYPAANFITRAKRIQRLAPHSSVTEKTVCCNRIPAIRGIGRCIGPKEEKNWVAWSERLFRNQVFRNIRFYPCAVPKCTHEEPPGVRAISFKS